MKRLPQESNRPDSPLPYTTLFRSEGKLRAALRPADPSGPASPRRRALRLRMRLASCEDVKAGCRRASRSTTGPDQCFAPLGEVGDLAAPRSEEHTSELQSLMRISYAVFCLNKKKTKIHTNHT